MADPNVMLGNIRKLYLKRYPTEDDVIMLAITVQNLDEWLSRGGFKPAAWMLAAIPETCPASNGGTLACAWNKHLGDWHQTKDGQKWSMVVTVLPSTE